MLSTIFRNLITNAIKFTPRNGKISIMARKLNDKTEFSIRDTGLGMNEEKIANLFQVSKTTPTKGTEQELGSGLGLILCKEFVEKHHGKIWIESEENIGSTIKFIIPN